MADFKGSACGREVLKSALTQLLLYYTRLLDLVKGAGPEGAALSGDAVMHDIKRFTRGALRLRHFRVVACAER